MRRILCTIVAALASAGAVLSAGWNLRDIDVNMRLYRDGSAIVTEVWDLSASQGTEVYIPRENLANITISDLSVTDETGRMYTFEERWDVNRSLAQKAGRCGFNRTSSGVEICWGLGSYGSHQYTVRYRMSNVVKALNDYDMVHLQMVNEDLASPPKHVKVTVEIPDRQIDSSWVRIWGFGFNGTSSFSDGKAVFESSSSFSDASSVIVLMRFEQGFFEPETKQPRDFETVLYRAMEGADFGSSSVGWKEGLISLLMSLLSMAFVIFVFLLPFFRMIRGDKLSRRQKKDILGGTADKVAWSRDIPFDGDLYKTDYILDLLETKRLSNGLASAMILRMLQKGYLTARKDRKDKVEILFDESKDASLLDSHERRLYNMMKEASGSDTVLQDKEFSRWSSKTRGQNAVKTWADGISEYARKALKEDDVCSGKKFSDQGKTEARKVIGFKNFLNDFTLVGERESVEASLWQEYLVYGALYGIADKVAKELKDIDPKVFEQVVVYDYNTFYDVVRMTDTLARSITNARYAPASSAGNFPSKGSWGGFGGGTSFGGGGGFSGGGFGGGVR